MGNTDLEILKEKVRIFREKFIEKTKHWKFHWKN